MNKDETPGKDPEEISIGTFHYDDGNTETISAKEFLELLRKANRHDFAKDPNTSDRESFKKLLEMLNAILDADTKYPDVFADLENREEIRIYFGKLLQIIGKYLDAHNLEVIPPADTITRFLRGEIDYMMAPRPRGYNELLKISSTGEQGIQYREDENKVRISFPNRLAIEEQKIRQACELALLDKNFYGAKKNLLTRVTIPIDEIMKVLDRPNNPENKKKFKQQLSPKRKGKEGILDDIKNTYIEIRAAGRKGEGPGDWIRLNIGQACGIVNDHIYFQFSEDYARYINTGMLKPYHKKLMLLGSRQFPLPYYVGQKIHDQYFHYGNQRRGAHDSLQIRTLLNHCKEVLDYDYILEADPTHWKRLIKEKYERALNEIQEKGVFTWEYCGPGQKEITQAEVEAADFYQWSELYITFALIPEEPEDQEQRIERRQKRIEAAKERKALEDAQAPQKDHKNGKRGKCLPRKGKVITLHAGKCLP